MTVLIGMMLIAGWDLKTDSDSKRDQVARRDAEG